MTRRTIAGLLTVVFACAAVLQAQDLKDLPKPAAPEKEHQWLQQLVGEWDSESEAILGSGQPPMKCKGTESTRGLGGFWVVAEIKNTFMDMPMTGIMTIGYDPQKKKYVGTWVDSMTNHLWKYEGTVDAAGKVLTLEAEGPNPMTPRKTARFRDSIEIKSKDHKVMRSAMLGEDGKWITFMTGDYRRKK